MDWNYLAPLDPLIVTRDKIARFLATEDKYEWQAHPESRQAMKQHRYKRQAQKIVELALEHMQQPAWRV